MGPVFGACRVVELVQVRHHFGAVLGVMADSAAGLVQFMAQFANRRFGMTLGTVTLEDRLPVKRSGLLVERTVYVRAVRG